MTPITNHQVQSAQTAVNAWFVVGTSQMLQTNRTKKAIHFRITDQGVSIVPPRWRRVYAPPLRDYAPYLCEAPVYAEKYIDAAHTARCKRESNGGDQIHPTTGERRAATTINNDWSVSKPAGYYRLFCAHDRALWVKCAMCKRDRAEAAVNWTKLISHTL